MKRLEFQVFRSDKISSFGRSDVNATFLLQSQKSSMLSLLAGNKSFFDFAVDHPLSSNSWKFPRLGSGENRRAVFWCLSASTEATRAIRMQ